MLYLLLAEQGQREKKFYQNFIEMSNNNIVESFLLKFLNNIIFKKILYNRKINYFKKKIPR
jgi:predicted transglutaminase-like protease